MAIGFIATAGSGNGGASVTVLVPSGTVNSDNQVMIASIWRTGTTGNTPTGWTLLQTGLFNVSSRNVKVYRKVVSSEPASYLFDGGTSTFTFGYIDTFNGVDATTPEDVTTPASTDNQTGALVTFPSITTVTAGAWHLAMMADNNNVNDVATPAGYTIRGIGPVNTKASETFSTTVTVPALVSTTAARTSGAWSAISVALRPYLPAPPEPYSKDLDPLELYYEWGGNPRRKLGLKQNGRFNG